MIDYPIKFSPILKEKIWGGSKLNQILKKGSKKENLGESWEISGVQDEVTTVQNGELKGLSLNELVSKYKADFLGKEIYQRFGPEFPLLIKFIDAGRELSVQLHPNDELARSRHKSFGKTEMWYVLQADKGAKLNLGLKEGVEKEDYLNHLNPGRITEILNFEEVKQGDSFFIKSGMVHAIGAGVLLAEIQQTSDITYRIYDWDRKDAQGISRELHTDLALDAIDFEAGNEYRLEYSPVENGSSRIASCEYFTTNFLSVKGEKELDNSQRDSFVIYMCVKGSAKIEANGHWEEIEAGQTLLVPAINKQLKIEAETAEFLEVYIE